MIWQGRFNDLEPETSVGGSGPFAPPVDYSGDYYDWMRQQWGRLEPRQQIFIVARRMVHGETPTFRGSNAEQAMTILRQIADKYLGGCDARNPVLPEVRGKNQSRQHKGKVRRNLPTKVL